MNLFYLNSPTRRVLKGFTSFKDLRYTLHTYHISYGNPVIYKYHVFPIKVNSNAIELTVHTSCYCVLDLMHVIQ